MQQRLFALSVLLPVLSAQKVETVLYAATDSGVYRSTNTGRTWQTSSQGLEGIRVTQVISGMRNDSRVAWAATEGGVFRTTDGKQWTRSLDILRASSIVVDPSNEQRVYAAASGKLFGTSNGGGEWATINAPFPVAVVAVDAYVSNRIYISATHTYDLSFATSTDRGQTWRTFGWIRTFPFLAVDPSTSGRLYTSLTALLQSNDYGLTWIDAGPNSADLFGVLPEGAHTAQVRQVMAVNADPDRPGDVHTCIQARWTEFEDPEDRLGPSRSGLTPGWASRVAGLWAAGILPGEQPCTAIVRLTDEDATLYAAGTQVWRRDGLVARRIDMLADLGSPIRSLAAVRASE